MNVEFADMVDLLKASAEFTQLELARRAKRTVIVRLARRITSDFTLSDEEAIERAGAKAVAAIKSVVERGA